MSVRGGDGGGGDGDGGDGDGALRPSSGGRPDGIHNALQSIALTVGQMQETMMNMIRMMERTDEAVRGVERRLTEQGEIVQKIGNRMNVLDRTLHSQDTGMESEARTSKSTPSAVPDSPKITSNSHLISLMSGNAISAASTCSPSVPNSALPRKTCSLPPTVFSSRYHRFNSQPPPSSRSCQTSLSGLTPIPSPTRSKPSGSPEFSPPLSTSPSFKTSNPCLAAITSPTRSRHSLSSRVSPSISVSCSPDNSCTHLPQSRSHHSTTHHSKRSEFSPHFVTKSSSRSETYVSENIQQSPYNVQGTDSTTSTNSSPYSSDQSISSKDSRRTKVLKSESSYRSSSRASPSRGHSSRIAKSSPRPQTPYLSGKTESEVRTERPKMRSASTSPSRPSFRTPRSKVALSSSMKGSYNSRSGSCLDPTGKDDIGSSSTRSLSMAGASCYDIRFPSTVPVRNLSKSAYQRGRSRSPARMPKQFSRSRCASPGCALGATWNRSSFLRSFSRSPVRYVYLPTIASSSSIVDPPSHSAPVREFVVPLSSPYFACPEESAARCAQLQRLLMAACHEGKVKEVRSLIELGADVNCSNSVKWTPLHKAAAKAHAAVVVALLQEGADVRAATSYGFTALHMAAYNDLDGQCVSLLVQAGSDVNCGNRSGRTPLHSAVECGNVAAIMALLAAGADKAARDEEGRTPYGMAKSVCVRRLLRLCGASPRARSKSARAKDVAEVAAKSPDGSLARPTTGIVPSSTNNSGDPYTTEEPRADIPAARVSHRISKSVLLRRFWRSWRKMQQGSQNTGGN